VPDRCEYAFDGVRRPQVIPMLGREVEEGQQCFAILGQAFDRLARYGWRTSTASSFTGIHWPS
jgi:hypothetical protein